MHVTERQAASMYARACRPRVVKNTIKQLRAVNDEAGVRMDSEAITHSGDHLCP